MNKLFGNLYCAETVIFNKENHFLLMTEISVRQFLLKQTYSFSARVSVGDCEKTVFVFSRGV